MAGTKLSKAAKNGRFIVTAECKPPRGPKTESIKACASALGKTVHAIAAPGSEDGVRLPSLAVCCQLSAADVEPILYLLTRDVNRIALQSAILGAASMGIGNIMCLSGRHQALTTSGSARGVFDVDPIQLLRIADGIRKEGKLADGQTIDAPIELLLGTDTNPFADPMELQIMALEAAVVAGADFVITQPVFNMDKFSQWMSSVRDRGIQSKTCIIASVMPLSSAQEAASLAEKFRYLDIPEDAIKKLESTGGTDIAVKTIEDLRKVDGVRGIHLMTGENFELAANILKTSGLSGS